MGKLKNILTQEEKYETVSSTFYFIPILLGFTKYSLKPIGSYDFYLVGYSIHILFFEFRLLGLWDEAWSIKRKKKQPPKIAVDPQRNIPIRLHIFQSTETGKCFFIRDVGDEEYERSAIGFQYIDTIVSDGGVEGMIEKLKEYEEKQGVRIWGSKTATN